ncbi:MAG: hypothetical protein ACRDRG_16100 [Pseudonocardiaceae bacterium]
MHIDRGAFELLDVPDGVLVLLLNGLRRRRISHRRLVLKERVAMHPDEGAKDFHNGGLVFLSSGGVLGDLFEGVDTA